MNHIVLVHPVIPQNTGNIMRTCVATNTALHIIKPIGFSLDDKHMRRAGLDYIKNLNMTIYESWDDFVSRNPGHYHFYTRYSKRTYADEDYTTDGDHYLLFGHEHDGIPHDILKEHLDECGFACSVVAHNAQLLITCKVIVEVLEDDVLTKRLAHILRLKNLVADVGAAHLQPHVALLDALLGTLLQFVERLNPVSRFRGSGTGSRAHPFQLCSI